MNKYKLYAGLFCTGAIALVSGAWQAKPTKQLKQVKQRPNIIVILVDDMGFSDVSYYVSGINIPNTIINLKPNINNL